MIMPETDLRPILLMIAENRERIAQSMKTGKRLLLKSPFVHLQINPTAPCKRCGNPREKMQGRRFCMTCSPVPKRRAKR